MLGDASDFTPLDLLGSLGLSSAATHFACKDGTLRVGLKIAGKDGVKAVQPYTDARFLVGIGAVLAAQFGPPMARRVGNDVANGLLHSYVNTETCRMSSEASKSAAAAASAAPQAQIPESSPREARREKQKASGQSNRYGSMNSAYAW